MKSVYKVPFISLSLPDNSAGLGDESVYQEEIRIELPYRVRIGIEFPFPISKQTPQIWPFSWNKVQLRRGPAAGFKDADRPLSLG